MRFSFILFHLFALSTVALGQDQTVGLFLNGPEAFDGYTLVAPASATRTHLIDNCGRIVHQWDSEYRTGESAYLLEDGSLLRTARLPSTTFNGGGIGGRLERFSWEGDLLWTYTVANDSAHHHHDVAMLPNGNVVMLCWEMITAEEAAAAGRLTEGPLWPPMLLEIEPVGEEGGNVVWEWHAWDHMVQDVDSTLASFGEPALHPTRFDLNYGQVTGGGFPGGNAGGDWFHCNAIAHHPGLDHLILNSRNWNEFYIIDHGISSEEAAGPAGDLLYRWGNPQTYGRGDAEDRQFYQQHDAHWIVNEGPSMGGGDSALVVLVYNNGNGRPGGDGSSVDEVILPWNDDQVPGHYTLPPDDVNVPFGPADEGWSWPEVPGMDFHSHNISGSQRLPNGNTLICEGNKGRIFEITPAGDIVWEYITAYNQFGPIGQGDNVIGNSTFRAYRYGPQYPGLAGRDLTPGDPVEGNPLPADCTLYPAPVDTTTNGVVASDLPNLGVFPNPFRDEVRLHVAAAGTWNLFDLTGKTLDSGPLVAGTNTLDLSHLARGIFVLIPTDLRGQPAARPVRLLHH